MEKQLLESLVRLRTDLIKEFEKIRDYKNNKNAIMKEVEHARVVHSTIARLDLILKGHVKFE
jgi:hypothetical protein